MSVPHGSSPPPSSSLSRRPGRYGSMGDIPSSLSVQRTSTDEFYSATDSDFSPIPDNTTRQIDIEAAVDSSAQTEPVIPVPLTVWGRVWQFLSRHYLEFYYSLFPRSEVFRTDFASRFTNFDSDSTESNDRLWFFYKIVYVVGMYGTWLCVIAGVLYKVFGEAKSSPPSHIHSFKLNSPAANTVSLWVGGFVFSLVYWVGVLNYWDDLYFYKIREKHMALVSLDLVVTLRIVKALLLTFYGFHNFEKEWGDWTIVVFAILPFFFTLSSISLLKLFEHEFLNATGLLRDFSVILVGPCYIFLHNAYKLYYGHSHHHHHHQDSHDYSLLKGGLFFVAIIFGYVSGQWVPYIYRPHQSGNRYALEDEGDRRYGPDPRVQKRT